MNFILVDHFIGCNGGDQDKIWKATCCVLTQVKWNFSNIRYSDDMEGA
jgi:hypothetical protein